MENDLKTLSKTESDYHFYVKPWQKPWSKADKLEVSFTLDLDNEKKTFRGLIDLVGITRKGEK